MKIIILLLISFTIRVLNSSACEPSVPDLNIPAEFLETDEVVRDRFSPALASGGRRLAANSVLDPSCLGGSDPDRSYNVVNLSLRLALDRARKCYEKFRFRELPSLIEKLQRLNVTCNHSEVESTSVPITGSARPISRIRLRRFHADQLGEYEFDLNPSKITSTIYLNENYGTIAQTMFHEGLHLTSCNNRHDHNEIETRHPNNCTDDSRYEDRVVFITDLCMSPTSMAEGDFCQRNCLRALTHTTEEQQSILENRFSRRWGQYYVATPYPQAEAELICNSVTQFQATYLNTIRENLMIPAARLRLLFNVLDRDLPAADSSLYKRELAAINTNLAVLARATTSQVLSSDGELPESLLGIRLSNSPQQSIDFARQKIIQMRQRLDSSCPPSSSPSYCLSPAIMALRSQLDLVETSINAIPAEQLDWLQNPSIQDLLN